MFTPAEFQTLLCGKSVIDIGLLRKVAEYEFVQPNAPHIQYMWSVLEAMPQDQRQAFLNFVWGRCVNSLFFVMLLPCITRRSARARCELDRKTHALRLRRNSG